MMRKKFFVLFLAGFISSCFLSCYAVNNREWDYRSKVYQNDAKTKYKKKLFPESGYMTMEQYNKKSVAKDKSVGSGEFVPKRVTESGMVYVPQPKYKLVRYNNPPGSAELNLHDNILHIKRQELGTGLVSPDVTRMILPIVYYYPKTKTTQCEVYIIPLRKGQPDLEKVMHANIAARIQPPIFSTDKTHVEYALFRTITPVDFSADGTKVLAKEKLGSGEDGIWKTEILIYDFNTNKTTKLPDIREAVRYYWLNTKNLDVKEIRWDLYPLGFDINSPDRILISAYAYAGNPPINLGIWSMDINGEQVRMESLSSKNVSVSVNGFKLVQDGYISPESAKAEANLAAAYEKAEKKAAKKAEKARKKKLKKEYKEEVKEIKQNYKELKKDPENEEDKTKKAKIKKHLPYYKYGKPTGYD